MTDSRLCSICMNRAMGHNIEKYREQVEAMDHPTLLTLTIENVKDLEVEKEAIQEDIWSIAPTNVSD